MGLFLIEYVVTSKAAKDVLEQRIRQRVIADACNRGYTPNGDPVLKWSISNPSVKVSLPVVERTP